MKKIVAFILIILLFTLSACGGRDEQIIVPASSVPGYFSAEQVLSGGNSEVADANLKNIEILRRQEDYVLTISFADGSVLDNRRGDPAGSLPAYTLSVLDAPARLVVELPDCLTEGAAQELEQMGEFLGYFYEKSENGATLYFQFTGGIVYKAEEGSGKLTLCVRASDDPSVEHYHVKTVYRDENVDLSRFDFTPALCEDGINLCRLSPAIGTVEEADILCDRVNMALDEAGSDDTAEVILMESGKAPVYTSPVSHSLLTMMGALRTETGIVDGVMIGMDARFICWDNEGSLLMACPQTALSGDGETESIEELWVYGASGKRKKLLETPFFSIQKAAVSPDGRYIAILEAADGDRLLYLYDTQSDALTFLSAEGFGDYTADFCWGENGILYGMCGDESMQMIAFDPKIQPIEDAFTAVEEREGGNGNVAVSGDHVYFNDEYGNVYSVSILDSTRELYETADGFLLSPDGQNMLLITYDDIETGNQVTLNLKNISSGEKTEIASGMMLSAYVFSGDSKALFMLCGNDNAAEAEDYPVNLLKYSISDGSMETLGALASNSIFCGQDENNLILMFYQSQGEDVFRPITYRLRLK